MSHIDFLVQNSSKKIMQLVKDLPDWKQLEAAFAAQRSISDTASSQAKIQRFSKHPRACRPRDSFADGSEEDDTTASTIRDEVVTIKTPALTPSSDELGAVTIRTDTADVSASLEERAYCMSRRPKRKDGNMRAMRQVRQEVVAACKTCSTTSPSTASQSQSCSHLHSQSQSALPSVVAAEEDSLGASMLQNAEVTHSGGAPRKDKCELHLILDHRMRAMVDRSMNILKECRSLFNVGVEPPDGQEDWERRHRRNLAFSSRFSRNYLYQLNRNRTEIKDLIIGKARRTTNSYVLGQRFYNVFQTICQALDAYKKHIPNGLANGLPAKFRELLEIIQAFLDLFNSASHPSNGEETAIDLFGDCCRAMLTDPSLAVPTRGSSLAVSLLSKQALLSGSSNGHQSRGRLSMYSVPLRRDCDYEYKVAMAAKQKYQVPSKYKTATFKHRPPPQAQPVPDANASKRAKIPYVEPLQLKKRTRSRKLGLIDMDNNVSTYVQDTVADGSGGEHAAECDELRRHARGFFDKVNKGKQEMSAEEYACILDHFVEIIGEEKLPEGAAKARHTQQLLEAKFEKKIDGMCFDDFVNSLVSYANSNERGAPQREAAGEVAPETARSARAATVSVSGPSNAKLICMKEAQADGGDDVASAINATDAMGILMQKLSGLSVAQKVDSNELIYLERNSAERIDAPLQLDHITIMPHRPENAAAQCVEKVLDTLPKDLMLNLIEYKLRYHKGTKESFMYQKTADFATWLVVARISDTIMEDALTTVTRDIHVDQILQKIYAQEFK